MTGLVLTADERLAPRSMARRLLGRPELGAVVGAAAVFVFFSVAADSFLQWSSFGTVLYASSTIGIMAVPVALLMIGGEFDLSAGVMVTSSALASSMFSFQMTANVWVGIGVSLLVTLAFGAFNGIMLVRTKLPSFIITLGTFLMLTGLNLGLTKLISGTVATKSIGDMEGLPAAHDVFASHWTVGSVDLQVTILWWFGLVAVATWVLLRTRALQLDIRGRAATPTRPARSASRWRAPRSGCTWRWPSAPGSPASTCCSPSTWSSRGRASATSSSTSSRP